MALINKLENLGDAVREKTGTTDLLTLDEMAEAIRGIAAGPTAEELTFSGSINNLFAHGTWNWFLEKYKDQIAFENITNAQGLFNNNTSITDLSMFEVPLNTAMTYNMFNHCQKLTKLPVVTGTVVRYIGYMFSSCYLLSDSEINNFLTGLGFPESTDNNCYFPSIFDSCYSVRDLSLAMDWLDNAIESGNSTSTSTYSYQFAYCAGLNDITNLYVYRKAAASNQFSGTFTYCARLKDMMFRTEDGVPYTVSWKSQTIDLSHYCGYTSSGNAIQIYNYNSGITQDKKVTDDATYQALKDDPDWWTMDVAYSRYNHDSAVNTINSLPDTSAYLATAGGTNTIKFTGQSGAKTDGGAINTLTEEEIAVATAKGWTVTLV